MKPPRKYAAFKAHLGKIFLDLDGYMFGVLDEFQFHYLNIKFCFDKCKIQNLSRCKMQRKVLQNTSRFHHNKLSHLFTDSILAHAFNRQHLQNCFMVAELNSNFELNHSFDMINTDLLK